MLRLLSFRPISRKRTTRLVKIIFKYVNQQCSLKIDSAAHTNGKYALGLLGMNLIKVYSEDFRGNPSAYFPLHWGPPQLDLSSNQCLNSLISRHLLYAENVRLFGFCNSAVDSSAVELKLFLFNPAEFKVQNLFLSLMQCIASVFNVFIRSAIRGRWCQHFGFVWTAFVPVQTLPYET